MTLLNDISMLTITWPDDWHVHFRDSIALSTTVPHTARTFRRAIAMPNLKPAITTTDAALAYRQRLLSAVPAGCSFEPLMTLYLTEQTTAKEIQRAKDSGHIYAVKLYPAGATTHSAAGVKHLRNIYPVCAALEKLRMPLLIHAEVIDPEIDIFYRETVFIERELIPLVKAFPALPIVIEHLTTKDGVQYVQEAAPHIGATITAHHLLMTRNDLFAGGIRPHYYCLPVLKRETDRQALLQAAISGNPKFFLGTDSAPHSRSSKETECGCAGIYTAHAAIEIYAEIFEKAGALEKLEGFASFFGADFYGLPRNSHSLTLTKVPWTVPETYPLGEEQLVPFYKGKEISWQTVTQA